MKRDTSSRIAINNYKSQLPWPPRYNSDNLPTRGLGANQLKIAVTGANGYVGDALCGSLIEAGHSITTITRTPFARHSCINLVLPHPVSTLAIENYDCFIHLAARTHHIDSSKDNLEVYRRDNVDLSCSFAQLAIDAGVKRFIYISSIKVNGEQTNRPFRYDDAPAPQDAYGISKSEAESRLKSMMAASATELVIIRPPLVWGEHPKGNLQTLLTFINRGMLLPFKSINNKRDIVSLENLCSLITVACKHPKAAGEIFLVSDGKPRSTAEIILLLEKQSPRKAKLISIPDQIFQLLARIPILQSQIQKLTGNLEIDISHTQHTLNWAPKE